jgi:hypothetical protein
MRAHRPADCVGLYAPERFQISLIADIGGASIAKSNFTHQQIEQGSRFAG